LGGAITVFTNECVCCVFSRVGGMPGAYYYLTGVLLPGAGLLGRRQVVIGR